MISLELQKFVFSFSKKFHSFLVSLIFTCSFFICRILVIWSLFFFLYSCIVLDKNSITNSILNATDSSMLWHSRLGHTSNKVLQQLCSQYNEISFDSIKPCDTCHYAKQKKFPFSLSTTVSSKFFWLNSCWYLGSLFCSFLWRSDIF